ncbi:MAG TPA: nucleotidyltransferase family protein [Thermoanaerobaculia bacterium]|jgi:hypothetical protein|nr:nucleotidyltransferase family protein [Thermoanaerobaculia bacterium]
MNEIPVSLRVGCELLSRLLHPSADQISLTELKSLGPGDWDDLLEQAEHHQVSPLLHRALDDPERRAVVPAAAMERLEVSYFNTAAGNASLFAQLKGVLEALRAAGIPVIALKGAHLAEIVYGNLTLRSMGDVDVLVRREDLPRVEQVLTGLGYHPQEIHSARDYSVHRHLLPFVKAGAFPIEIHRTIDESGQFAIDVEGLWERARPARIAGVEALVLSPEDLLLHLCLHTAFQHGFRVPLRQICDLAAAVRHYGRELDWRGLVRAAETSGLSKVCYYALAVAESLLGAGVPAETLATLQVSGGEERMVAVIREYVLVHPSHRAPGGIKEVIQAQGAWERMRSLLQSVFPSPARLREIYSLAPGSKAVYGYYPVRLWDLLVRRGGFLAQLASRGSEARAALDVEAKGLLIRRQLEEKPLRRGEAGGR